MANTFYSYLAFITPASDANLIVLKNNLEIFYARPAIKDKPEIVFENNQITIIFDGEYRLSIAFSEEEYVNEEALEIAQQQQLDYNENIFDKTQLETCCKRFEVWGDDDFDMDYFNDSLFVIEAIEKFNGIIIFAIQ